MLIDASPMRPRGQTDAIAFVVVSCDKYSDLWDPFFHCLRKYWPDCPCQVYLVTNYKDYDAPGVQVIKIGEDRSYSDNLSAAISQISESWAILWLEDVFISQTVDTQRFDAMMKFAQSVPVGYLKLSPDLPLSYDESVNEEIGPLPKGIRYRSAIGLSLYNLTTLKKLLLPNASAWDLDTSDLSNDLDEPFFALTSKAAWNPPIMWTHGVIKGQWYWAAIPFLKREGFSALLKQRKVLSIRSFLYVHLFKIHNMMFRLAKRYWY